MTPWVPQASELRNVRYVESNSQDMRPWDPQEAADKMASEKYVSLAGKLSLLFVFTSLAGIQLIRDEMREHSIFLQARMEAADWFFYNANLNPMMARLFLLGPNAEPHFKNADEPQTFVNSYYDSIGRVMIHQSQDSVYVEVGRENATIKEEPRVQHLHAWQRVLPIERFGELRRPLQDKTLRDLAELQLRLAHLPEVQTAVQKGLLNASYTLDPRLHGLTYGQYTREIQLSAIAEQLHLDLPLDDRKNFDGQPDENHWGAKVYHLIERRFFERTVKVPVLDLQLTPMEAATTLSVINLVLIISLMSCLSHVRADITTKVGEPWLILDSSGWLANALGIVWAVMVVPGLCTRSAPERSERWPRSADACRV